MHSYFLYYDVVLTERVHKKSSVTPPITEDEKILKGDGRFQCLIENIKQYAFITLDKDGYIQSWDGGAELLLQYRAKEIIGRHSSIIFTAQDIKKNVDKQEMRNAKKFGFSEDERWHVRKDGTTFWGSGIMAPLYFEGKLIGFGKIFRDRTKHTAHERRKDDFVGIAGHELRNPLSVIKSTLELSLLMPEVNESPRLLNMSKNMNERVDRLSHLVNDLLDLSKIASGQLVPVKRKVNMKKILKSVADDYSLITMTHSVCVVHAEDVTVRADERQIIQVLNNLITNAIKYSPRADKVELYLYDRPEHAYIEVRDYGPGVSELDMEKIFDRFYRSGKDLETVEGLGIGLYVSLEIVKAHGGTMGIENHKDKGAVFHFTIPK
jgi:PAS domain S-box-containing protein